MSDAAAPNDNSAADSAPCRQCRTPIPAEAALCRHCNSYQDWRRHLNLSSTILALLVALVSVLGTALPTIVDALRPQRSNIVLSSPVMRGEAVYIVVSNLGTKPGIIQRGLIHSPYLGEMDSELEMISADDGLVRPGSKQIGLRVRLRLSGVDANFRMLDAAVDGLKKKNTHAKAGHIGIWMQGSHGPPAYSVLPVSYEDIVTLLDAHSGRCKAIKAPTLENGCSGIRELREENDRLHQEIQRDLGGVISGKRANSKVD